MGTYISKYTGKQIDNGINPVGTIISFMGTIAPEGFLICDGSELNVSEYANLANHFEAQFGNKNYFGGDGETTFALPDLRNEFLRGYHGGASEQLSGDVGVHQDATAIPNTWHYHNSGNSYAIVTTLKPSNDNLVKNQDASNMDIVSDTQAKRTYTSTGNANASNYTADIEGTESKLAYSYTVRPTNVAVLYCIKY
jgi:microcystin-dependent protein